MQFIVRQLQIRKTPDGERYFAETRFGPGSLEECAEYTAELTDAGKTCYIWPVLVEGHPLGSPATDTVLPSGPDDRAGSQ